MKLPTNLSALALNAGLIVTGMITGLAAAHDAIPSVLPLLATGLITGGVGIAIPTPTPTVVQAPASPPAA